MTLNPTHLPIPTPTDATVAIVAGRGGTPMATGRRSPRSLNPSRLPIPTPTYATVVAAAGRGGTPTAIGRSPRGASQKRKLQSTWPERPNRRSHSFLHPYLISSSFDFTY